MTRSPLVAMEDAIAEELVLAELGVTERPRVEDRYVILAIRGRGARGLVCRAMDERLDRVVALKLYPPIGDPRIEAEIAREAKALARLDHPNVVRVHDVALGTLRLGGRTMQTSYLSMELVEGRNLRAWLADGVRDSGRVRAVVRAIGAALVAAHARGIVHRDVKPENVMIDEAGEVRVVDFGLARSIATTDEAERRSSPDGEPAAGSEPLATSFGKLTGTIEYMAPEAREGVADARSDQFSFAMTAWECLSGVLPFDARVEVCRDPAMRPFDGRDTLPPEFRAPLERAMDRDPNARFPSVEALLDAMAPPRRRSLAWLGAFALLAIGGAAAFALVGPAGPTDDGRSIAEPSDAGVEGNRVLAPTEDAGLSHPATPGLAHDASTTLPPVDAGRRPVRCRDLSGVWELVTTATESRVRSVPVGNRAYFTFTVRTIEACDAEVFVVKLGDDTNTDGPDGGALYTRDDIRDDRRRIPLVERDGVLGFDEIFGLASSRRVRREYRFSLRFENDRLVGEFSNSGSNGQLVQRGTALGSRLAEGALPFAELIAPPPGTSLESEP